jgi:hypothetical protein
MRRHLVARDPEEVSMSEVFQNYGEHAQEMEQAKEQR